MVVEIDESRLRAGPPGEVQEIAVGSSARVLEEMAGLFAGTGSPDSFELSAGSAPDSVTLRPRDPAVARVVESIEIGFDPEGATPRWVRIDEVGGDRTRIEMSDVRVQRGPGRSP